MPSLLLTDFLPLAQQESYQMRHYFIGVEHLFISLLETKGSIAARILEESGYTPDYIINAIRLKIGKGLPNQHYADFPQTPRAQKVLKYANRIAKQSNHPEIDERDLLLAILVEQDNIPVRVLKALKFDIEALALAVEKEQNTARRLDPYIKIEYAHTDQPEIAKPYQLVLKHMFRGYARIRIEHQLLGGYTHAQLFVVTPIQVDNVQHAAVVAKIDRVDQILEEARRYNTHIKNTLPPLTARLEEKPTVPENADLAGLKYTFVAGPDETPRNLRAIVHEWGAPAVAHWIRHQLYPSFGRYWWMQGRPYRFEVWREYDWLLPPLFTIDYQHMANAPVDSQIIRYPVRQARITHLQAGDRVTIENFIVHEIDPHQQTITLALGTGSSTEKAYRIKVRGIDTREMLHYPGEVIESLTGQIWNTRKDQMAMAIRDLSPDFDLREAYIPITQDRMHKVVNPLHHYETLLDQHVNGLTSKIHGDMHLGNILVGPGDSAFLIDFAHARDGHIAFDWASLEISLLSELVMPLAGSDWNAARSVIEQLMRLNQGQIPASNSLLGKAFMPIVEVRRVIQDIMQTNLTPLDWRDYQIALAMSALRATRWDTMTPASRRLMFLLAGLAIHELQDRHEPDIPDTNSGDDTFNLD